MIHSSAYKPNIFPYNGDIAPAEIDRAQSIDPTSSLNREKIEEIGREGVVGYIKKSPTITYRLSQYEYGSIEFWQKLVNNEDIGGVGDANGITISDFKTPTFDISAYLTDDDDTFVGTVWYPKLRTSGFTINIGDPQDIIERSFDFVGESAIVFQGNNKYLIYQKEDVSVTQSDYDISLDTTAVQDPDDSVYMLRVLRVRSGATTLLVKDTDYIEVDSTTVRIASVTNGDVYKLYYTATTLPGGYSLFTANDSDPSAILADSASIYLYIPASGKPSSSDYIYRLQSVTLDVRFDREDLREIGNKNVVQRGISNTTVSATLGRILETHTIEEVLRGQASGYGKLDIEQFTDSATLIIKFFSDNTKTSFKYGIKAVGLSPTESRGGAGVNAYVNKEVTTEGEDITISANSSVIGI